jgi:hypothetical protein
MAAHTCLGWWVSKEVEEHASARLKRGRVLQISHRRILISMFVLLVFLIDGSSLTTTGWKVFQDDC